MKVIFLDFDGVLVNRASFSLPGSGSASCAAAHPDCVAALNSILEASGAFVVVSSVWRKGGLTYVKELLAGWGVMLERVLGVTPIFANRNEGTVRGDEIQLWLDEYERARGGVESFVIIDDDSDMGALLPRLVKTNFERGLTAADARRAVELLGGSPA